MTHIRYKSIAHFNNNNLICLSFHHVEAVRLRLRWQPVSASSVLAHMWAGCTQPLMQPGRAVWKASDAAWLHTPHVHLSSPPPTTTTTSNPLFTFRSGYLHYFHLLPLLWQHPLRTEGHWDFKGDKQFYAAGEVHLFLVSQCRRGRGGREGGAVKPPIWSSFFPIHYDVNSRISWADPRLTIYMSDDAMINN